MFNSRHLRLSGKQRRQLRSVSSVIYSRARITRPEDAHSRKADSRYHYSLDASLPAGAEDPRIEELYWSFFVRQGGVVVLSIRWQECRVESVDGVGFTDGSGLEDCLAVLSGMAYELKIVSK